MSDRDPSGFTVAVAGLALLLCCGAPLLLGALAAGGLGAGLLWQGALLAGLALLAIAGAIAVRYLRRGRAASCAECDSGRTSSHATHRSA